MDQNCAVSWWVIDRDFDALPAAVNLSYFLSDFKKHSTVRLRTYLSNDFYFWRSSEKWPSYILLNVISTGDQFLTVRTVKGEGVRMIHVCHQTKSFKVFSRLFFRMNFELSTTSHFQEVEISFWLYMHGNFKGVSDRYVWLGSQCIL